MRILIRVGMFSYSYPYNHEKHYEMIKKLILSIFRQYSFIKIILFDDLIKENNWSKNAILNPNIYEIDDIL